MTVSSTQPRLTGLNWVFLAGTGVLQAGYFLFLQTGYRLGDLSLVYPIGRGTGALLAALAGIVLLGERPGPVGDRRDRLHRRWHRRDRHAARTRRAAPAAASRQPHTRLRGQRATVFALITGVFIACYTLWDKYAVGTLHTLPLLQGYAAFPVMALVFTPQVHRATGPDRRACGRPTGRRSSARRCSAPLAYILVLIALSFTAVSAVAPAREVSVLFGVLLGRRLLGEGGLARRLIAAAAIVAGIIAIAVG